MTWTTSCTHPTAFLCLPFALFGLELFSSSDNHPQNPQYHSRDQSNNGGGRGSQKTPDFLARSPDAKWIDIEMMGYWLQKCDTEHGGECRKPLGLDPTYPGRPKWLVDVQKKCLVAAEPNHRYACLSYVWGGVATLKTGRANLDSLRKEQSLESHRDEIPRTIRDSISFVLSLESPTFGSMRYALSKTIVIRSMMKFRSWREYMPTPM